MAMLTSPGFPLLDYTTEEIRAHLIAHGFSDVNDAIIAHFIRRLRTEAIRRTKSPSLMPIVSRISSITTTQETNVRFDKSENSVSEAATVSCSFPTQRQSLARRIPLTPDDSADIKVHRQRSLSMSQSTQTMANSPLSASSPNNTTRNSDETSLSPDSSLSSPISLSATSTPMHMFSPRRILPFSLAQTPQTDTDSVCSTRSTSSSHTTSNCSSQYNHRQALADARLHGKRRGYGHGGFHKTDVVARAQAYRTTWKQDQFLKRCT